MSKTNWLLGAFISGAMFLFACSSTTCDCSDNPGSSGVEKSSSSIYSSSSRLNIEDQKLVRKNITLSSGNSYADIDGEFAAYTKEEAANKLDKIDLIAYCGTDGWCKNNSIYSPHEIELFWNPNYTGSNIYLFEIPPDQSDIFKTATRLSEILPTYNNLATTGVIGGIGVNEIPIAAGKVFFVVTSEGNYRIVIIKQAGNESVDLEIIEIPN
jgi:hypothetical protein